MFKIFIIALILLSLITIGYSPDQGDYWIINSGTTEEIDEHGVCREVSVSSGPDVYCPVKTSGEWSSFYNNAGSVSGVSLSACPSCTWQYTGSTTNGGQCPGNTFPTLGDPCTCGEQCWTESAFNCYCYGGSQLEVCDEFQQGQSCGGGGTCQCQTTYFQYECQ